MKFRPPAMSVVLLIAGITQRLWQWQMLSPQLKKLTQASPNWITMQYLPIEVWQKHFWTALWFLQQTPPLPNLVFGVSALLFPQAETRVMVLILFCGLMSCIAAVLLSRLLVLLNFKPWFAVAISLLFLGSSEILVMEYAELGQLLYEFMTMALIAGSAVLAVEIGRKASSNKAFSLGLTTALLALTRATFSYFDVLTLIWLAVMRRSQPKLMIIAAVPIIVLHGGWAFKQYEVLHRWQWATSTWGGANMQYGDVKRGDFRFNRWLNAQQDTCADQWSGYITGSRFGVFGFPTDKELVLQSLEKTADARSVDIEAAAQREQWLPLDSAAFRDMSSCLQGLYLRYWIRFPARTMEGAWRSYEIFWSPIDRWAANRANVIVPHPGAAKLEAVPPWLNLRNFLQKRDFSIRQAALQSATQRVGGRFVPITLLVLPIIPHAMALAGCIGLHLFPLVAICWLVAARIKWDIEIPVGISFLLLLYGYLVVVSSVVEFGENMRFRLPVEPIGWAIALVALDVFRQLVQKISVRLR